MKLPIESRHSGSQGDVINNLKRGLAEIGMVDEDPGSTHHSMRSQMQTVTKSEDLEHRVKGDRHLIIVKPDLESCFLRTAGRIKMETGLPGGWKDLHRILAVQQDKKAHEAFRNALRSCYEHFKSSRRENFVSELVRITKELTS
jgi:hypothetical protein